MRGAPFGIDDLAVVLNFIRPFFFSSSKWRRWAPLNSSQTPSPKNKRPTSAPHTCPFNAAVWLYSSTSLSFSILRFLLLLFLTSCLGYRTPHTHQIVNRMPRLNRNSSSSCCCCCCWALSSCFGSCTQATRTKKVIEYSSDSSFLILPFFFFLWLAHRTLAAGSKDEQVSSLEKM